MFKRLVSYSLLAAIFMCAAGVGTYLTIHFLIRSEHVVVVPDLTGKEVVYALETLSDLKLNIKVKGSEYNPTVPKHHVISQDPEPGSEIKQGRDVRLTLSKGAQAVVIPNLAGMNLPQARIFLNENDLGQGHLSHAYDAVRPNDEIMAQSPPPGTIALRGDRINLLVSAGPPPNTVPMIDLRGMTLNQAIEALESHHLVTGRIRSVRDPSRSDETILQHSPAFGHPVAVGSAVDLDVNQHVNVIGGVRSNDMILFRHRAPSGFLNQHVRVKVNRPELTIEMFSGFVKPGHEIWLLIPYEQPISVLLYLDDELVDAKRYD
jgi:serine/threonine-protein kinase